MKTKNFIAYIYHKFFRFIYRIKGKYQTIKFENHHHKMKKYQSKL